MLGKDFFIKRIIRLAKKYSWEQSDYVHVVFLLVYSMNERYKKEHFLKRIKVDFEDKTFWIPEGYDAILREYYGDYMQLPPEEKRVTHHANKIFWK